jgi:hypothetical protein
VLIQGFSGRQYVNRFGATVTAGLLLLSLAACGGSNKPAAAGSSIPPAPTSTPTPTPTADPTAVAKTQVLAAYATFITRLDKGYREGGVTYPFAEFTSGKALDVLKSQINFLKGFHRAKVTGNTRLVESHVSALDLRAKTPTATVTACVIDNLTAVSGRTGKTLAKPPGKVSRIDKLELVKGKWLVFSTDTEVASRGCTT